MAQATPGRSGTVRRWLRTASILPIEANTVPPTPNRTPSAASACPAEKSRQNSATTPVTPSVAPASVRRLTGVAKKTRTPMRLRNTMSENITATKPEAT